MQSIAVLDGAEITSPPGELNFGHLLEKLPAGAYTCDPDGLITYFNASAVQLWGRAPKLYDAEDRFCGSFRLYSADGVPISHSECWMALALRNGQSYNEQEIIVERPDGRRLTALAHANPIRDESGRLLGAVNVLVDITERKRAEEQLKEKLGQISLVQELSTRIARAASLEDAYRAALDAILDATRTDRAAILLFDESDVIRFAAWRGLSQSYREAVEGHSPWRPDEVSASPIVVSDVESDPSLEAYRSVILREGIHALAFVPLAYEDRLLGKFMVYAREARTFSATELQLAQTIANHVAFAIARMRAEKEQVQARQAIAASNAHLRAVLDAANVTILEEDFSAVAEALAQLRPDDGEDLEQHLRARPELVRSLAGMIQIIDANAEAMRRFGAAAREDLLGPLDRIVDPEGEEELIRKLAAFARGESHFIYEAPRRALDGRRIEVRTTVSLPPVTGSPSRVLVSSLDITRRKRAEADLGRTESAYRAVFENAGVGICVCEPARGRFMRVNPRYCEITGYSEDELQGMSVADITFPEENEQDLPQFERYLRGELPFFETEKRYRRKDGSTAWVAIHARLQFGADGRAESTVAVVQDVTDRRLAQEAVRESEELLRSLLEHMLCGVVLVEAPSGRLLYRNEQAGKLLRHPLLPGGDYATYSRYGAHHQDDAPYAAEEYPLARALSGEVVDQEEMLYRRGDGTLVTLSVSAAPIRNSRGDVVLAVSTFEDFTDRKQMEDDLRAAKEEAEEANRMKSVFLANMSHEIRTPLTAILGFASLLMKLTEGKAHGYAERIEKSGKRLTETLSSVLTLARLEAGRVEVVLESAVVADEVREVAEIYRSGARAKGLAFQVVVTPGAQKARTLVDRGALTSVLQNLISNAIKFTAEGGIRVTVDVGGGDGQGERAVSIAVEDTGIGMTPQFLARVFEPFMQESTGISRSYEGSGLGLSIAKQLAEKMNGSLEAASEKGRGSRFTLTLLLTGNTDASVPAFDAPAAREPARRRVLVVEDHEDTRVLMNDLLSETYEVVCCPSSSVAMEQLEACAAPGGYDFILLDINLGEGPAGTDLLQRIREVPRYEAVPVAAITAYAMQGDADRYLREGFNGYLGKPFSAEQLLGLVKSLSPGQSQGYAG